MDVPENTRFAINYFISIGLGIITEEMRKYWQGDDVGLQSRFDGVELMCHSHDSGGVQHRCNINSTSNAESTTHRLL